MVLVGDKYTIGLSSPSERRDNCQSRVPVFPPDGRFGSSFVWPGLVVRGTPCLISCGFASDGGPLCLAELKRYRQLYAAARLTHGQSQLQVDSSRRERY